MTKLDNLYGMVNQNWTKQEILNEIDRINADIESRTCENRKYIKGVRSSRYNSEVDARHCTVLNQKVEDNFGCVKFKRRDK